MNNKKRESSSISGAGAKVPVTVAPIFADKIHAVEFGPGVCKILFAMEDGRQMASVVLPTLGFIETIQNLNKELAEAPELRNAIIAGLDHLRSRLTIEESIPSSLS